MINKSQQRVKQTGEIFTPTPLVQEILDKLPPELFDDPTKTFLDPAAGDGQFIIQVLLYKMEFGSTPTEALSTTYGVELMQDNVDECHNRIFNIPQIKDTPHHRAIVNHNIICANSLEFDYDSWHPYDQKDIPKLNSTTVSPELQHFADTFMLEF